MILGSCGDNRNPVSSLDMLEISTDTVLFDTVFTTVGSATEVFLIYNRGDEPIQIDELILAGSSSSPFRINIDGIPSDEYEGVIIPAGDSLYGFAEVTINPNDDLLPFVVKDSLVFRSGDDFTDVKFVAWGQNAIFHYRDTILETTTWDNSKPHILIGEVHVAGGAKLTIPRGTQIYGHPFSRLNIWRNSSLTVEGTVEEPVVFQGDRLDQRYEDEPGQWIGIRLLPGARENEFSHAIIKNGYIGIEVDSMPKTGEPNLLMEGCKITTMNLYGILSYTGNIQLVNCEISNSCGYLLACEFGGKANVVYSTLGNFEKSCTRTTGSLFASNRDFKTVDGITLANDLDLSLVNTIVYGSKDEELEFNTGGQGEFNLAFSNCLFKTERPGFDVNNSILNEDPKFVNPQELNYELDSASAAIGKALPLNEVQVDFYNNIRDVVLPDIGAYERQE